MSGRTWSPEQRQRVLAELRLPAIVQQLTKRDVYTFTNSVRLQDGSLRQEQLQFSYQDRETLFYCMSDITVQFIHENAQLADLAAARSWLRIKLTSLNLISCPA